MGKIKKLDKYLIPKIAAGEIVDRPASVIKELIDNSLDAKSTEIVIVIKNAGKELIKVIDNGEGMDTEDLKKCFDSFTTSKIFKEEDLNNIETYGFRGEALNSIVSVSKTNITTKQKDSEEGYSLKIIGGRKEKIKKVGASNGTIIEIEELFFNIPARKKFLKSDQTEVHHILNLVEKYCISNWDKSFKLIHNNKIVLDIKKSNSLLERLKDIYGNDLEKEIIEINNKNEYIKILGYIGTPKNSSYTSNKSIVFVNNRYIENKQILSTIKYVYGKLIENRAFPFYILFLEVMPVLVNINIHPQKKEVRFWNDIEVLSFIEKTIKENLENSIVNYDTDYFGNDIRGASKYQFNTLKEDTETWNIKGVENKNNYEEIFQIDNTYIVAYTKSGIVLIDQHAAHESILYKQYLNKYLTKQDTENTSIDINEIIEVTTTVKHLLQTNIDFLNNLGFEIEEFGGNTFKISKIPELFKSHNIKNLLEEMLNSSEDGKNNLHNNVDEKSKQTIEFLSCRGAIKAGETLTKDEMRNLAKKLDELPEYLTCPHGRPTRRLISIKDLQKMFKRI